MKAKLTTFEKTFLYDMFDRLQLITAGQSREMRVAFKKVRNRMDPRRATTKLNKQARQLITVTLRYALTGTQEEKRKKLMETLVKKVNDVNRSHTRKY